VAAGSIADFYTLKTGAIRSSETSVYTISTRRHIPEEGILQILVIFTNIKFYENLFSDYRIM
jgi:hypothetical protein